MLGNVLNKYRDINALRVSHMSMQYNFESSGQRCLFLN